MIFVASLILLELVSSRTWKISKLIMQLKLVVSAIQISSVVKLYRPTKANIYVCNNFTIHCW